MNSKNINKIFFLLFFLFIYSCKTTDFVNKNKKDDIIFNDEIENISVIDFYGYDKKNLNINDYYNKINLSNFNFDNNINKLVTINIFGKKYEDINPLIKIVIEDKIYSLDYQSNLKIYNLDNFKLIETLDLELNFINKDIFPTSIANINDIFFVSYSDGKIVSFDIKGNIKWSKFFKDIIKTPIKISNDNLIVLLSDSIISLSSINGNINWQYTFKNNNSLNVLGGRLVKLNQFIFFNLPNNTFGQIDTLFGDKIDLDFLNYLIDNNRINSSYNLHTYKNILTIIENNMYFYSFDVGINKLLVNKKKLDNIVSYKYYNNSLITFTNTGYLKAYNIYNKKIFWKLKVSDIIDYNDEIIEITSNLSNLVIFFKSGKFLIIDSKKGNLLSNVNLGIKNIYQIKSNDNIFYVDHLNGKTTFFKP